MKENIYIDPFSEKTKELSLRFDNALDMGDISLIEKVIEDAKFALPTEDFASQARIYYSLGTAYGDISYISSNDKKEEFLSRQIYYLRKSISVVESKELEKREYEPYLMGLKLNLYTNYANALDHIGRKIAAIEQYKKVLLINPKFGMALGNLGIAYHHYGMLVYDPIHRDYFHHFAYHYLSAAINISDNSIYEQAENVFRTAAQGYDSDYVEQVLKPTLEIPQYHYENIEEGQYRKWALTEGLSLNPLTDLPVFELCFAGDVLQLPDMLTKLDDKPIFHGMFNQFKQEYSYARYQYYSSLEVPEQPHFADKDTYLVNFNDYPQYSIRIESLKSAFKILYSLLDKIAYFINFYFELGIKERDVSFHNIWLEEKKGKSGYKYKNTLNVDDNFALSSIYWISKDFYNKIYKSPNPQAKHISDLRNALEHKYVKVYWDMVADSIEEELDGLAYYIMESELYKETLGLLKLIREVLISLSLAVEIEERKKRHTLPEKFPILPKINLMSYEDSWKL